MMTDGFKIMENACFKVMATNDGYSVGFNPKTTYIDSDVDKKTKAKVFSESDKLMIQNYCNGEPAGILRGVMPDIKDVIVIEQENSPKVVKVVFADDTFEKAVLDNIDSFSLEMGISICITKKLLSFGTTYGSTNYNKVVQYAIKKMNDNRKKEFEAEELKRKIENMRKMRAKKKDKRLAKKREEQIELQKEAYIRALREINTGNN